ncbi:MAG: SDR family NAD(P)-dependent oxidoreductase [Planctomycetota bacterium]|jgi:NAD(P)-dependent dehydrogenase (short-subunit alcohol dehydrogenase family)
MKKTALITGVAGGIGRATAEAFIEKGWDVIGIDRKGLRKPPAGCHFIRADVSDPKKVGRVFKKASGLAKRLDCVVNNAAIQICKPLLKMTLGEWDRVMGANVRSIYLITRHLYPLLRKPGGSIVNVSSVHAVATSSNIAAYAASKGAVLSLTRAMAIELAKDGIRVNAVLPGAVETEMLRAGLSRGDLLGKKLRQKMKKLSDLTVLGRIGQPEEIAQAILFLASNEKTSFLTGQSLIVDGGATARLSTE